MYLGVVHACSSNQSDFYLLFYCSHIYYRRSQTVHICLNGYVIAHSIHKHTYTHDTLVAIFANLENTLVKTFVILEQEKTVNMLYTSVSLELVVEYRQTNICYNCPIIKFKRTPMCMQKFCNVGDTL